MEAFSLLRYWIGGGGGGATASMRLSSSSSTSTSTSTTTTITTTVPRETDESDDDDDDEGPFFDLEFTVPVEDGFEDEGSVEEDAEEADRDSTVSSSIASGGVGSAADDHNPHLPFSPSENLFFKGGELMSLEPSSSAPFSNPCEANSKRQFPVSLLRSATKFRVFLLGFKKAKPPSSAEAAASSPKQQQHHSRFFTVKFKVEEVPIVSLFRRENSWRSCSCKRHLDDGGASEEDGISASEMKRLLKDVIHKYMKMLKPLNVRKDGERHRFSGQLSLLSFRLGGKPRRNNNGMGITSSSSSSSSSSSLDRAKKQQRQGSLKEVCRHLSKSRSVSSSTAGAAVAAASLQLQSQRRDDSLLQQQDGIQSAIAHCKRSLKTPLDSEAVAVC